MEETNDLSHLQPRSANTASKSTFSGAGGGNKGADEIYVRVLGTSDEVRINGNSGNDTITVTAAADNTDFYVAGGRGDDLITAASQAPTAPMEQPLPVHWVTTPLLSTSPVVTFRVCF